MKTAIFLIFQLLVLNCFCQTSFPQEIKEVDSVNLTNNQIYNKLNDWLSLSNYAHPIVSDKEAGKIAGKNYFIVKQGASYDSVKFNYVIDIKDGRYRIALSDFYHICTNGPNSGGSLTDEKPLCGNLFMSKSRWNAIKNDALANSQEWIALVKKRVDTNDNF